MFVLKKYTWGQLYHTKEKLSLVKFDYLVKSQKVKNIKKYIFTNVYDMILKGF